MNDTICAISTALGIGAISIIRVSGDEAIDIVNKIFKGKNLNEVATHTIHYGHIIDFESNELIDEVLVSIMKAPKTFTKEDIVEINCHGGIATTNKVLELLLNNGARLAEPGEFTKRAFLNGRIDLIEAEGVMDLINSKTEKARNLAINQVSGKVSNLIHELRQNIVDILANIEVNIDYPEYEDIIELSNNDILPKLVEIKNKMAHILKESENSKIIKEGIKTTIVGKPNVGKSSLLNALLEEEKAIVTDIAGTTRDIVEGTLSIDGIILNMIDTAGIRKTENIVEQIGVEKSLKLIDESDLILFILNNNEKLTDEDKKILATLKDKKHITIVNKIDLPTKLEFDAIDEKVIKISTLKKVGLDDLKNEIKRLFNTEQIEKQDFTYLTNARSISLLKSAMKAIDEAMNGIKETMPIDMVELDIKTSWELLGSIIGETYEEELLDQLFSQFCLGK